MREREVLLSCGIVNALISCEAPTDTSLGVLVEGKLLNGEASQCGLDEAAAK